MDYSQLYRWSRCSPLHSCGLYNRRSVKVKLYCSSSFIFRSRAKKPNSESGCSKRSELVFSGLFHEKQTMFFIVVVTYSHPILKSKEILTYIYLIKVHCVYVCNYSRWHPKSSHVWDWRVILKFHLHSHSISPYDTLSTMNCMPDIFTEPVFSNETTIVRLGAECVLTIPTPQKSQVLTQFYQNFYTQFQKGQHVSQALHTSVTFLSNSL